MLPRRCYRTANWIRVGQTQGRNKLDTRNEYALPVKDILLKPIHPHWCTILNHWTCPLFHKPLERLR